MNTGRRASQKKSHFVFWTTFGFILLGVIALGLLAGVVFGYALDLPRVDELAANQPSIVSHVYSDDGRILGQFALERRILVSYEQIPQRLKNAILVAEDANFFSHAGVDFRRLITTIINDLLRGERKGASTLTMQLSKLRFTSTEKTLERKIKDILYAINIEKEYSKEQIFSFYFNQVHMGHGNYGLAAAADYYFQKTPELLTLAECATLAGLIQSPARHSPINHPERSLARRNWVLGRMLDLGYISQAEHDSAAASPLEVHATSYTQSVAPYFVEWVRQYLETKYQTNQIWQGGLRVYTTVDYDMQLAAQRALREGLKVYDKERRRWDGPVENILEKGEQLDKYVHPDWWKIFYEGQMVHGLVESSDATSALVKIGTYTATLGPEDVEWTGRKRVDQVLKAGDIAVFSIRSIKRSGKVIDAVLDRIPEVQGAVLGIENRTGAIKAMVGGFDFEYSKFNRATQALRQPGSIFKPFTYVAAMEAGFSPSDQVLDGPATFQDALGRPYEPSNWDDEFKGLITIRQALAESRNLPTVRLANAIGPEKVAEVAHRFGLKQELPPYLSIALGSVEVTLSEIVSAFSCFPNHGVRAEPFFIKRVEDPNGVILEEHRPSVHDEILTPEVADKMLYMLREVVLHGTGGKARELGRPVAGKTGTTNESTDTWFVGMLPQLTSGVWIGFDEKKSLGGRMFGTNLALPIWLDFMKEADANLPVEEFEIAYTPDNSGFTRTVDSDSADAALAAVPPQEVKAGIQVEDIAPPVPHPQ